MARWLSNFPNAAVLFGTKAASWSRMELSSRPGPAALRSAAWPWGRPDLDAKERDRCDDDNAKVRETLDLLDLALGEPINEDDDQRPVIFLDTEDLGPRGGIQPASVWRLNATRQLAVRHGLMRSAAYQCEFGDARRPMPTGIFHNNHLPRGVTHRGWPQLAPKQGSQSWYQGPLPSRCNCQSNHQATEENKVDRRLTTDFLNFLIEHLLNAQVKNMLGQELRMEGASNRLPLTNVLASPLPDETDLDVEVEGYFDGFPRQDDFMADGHAVMSGYNLHDSADGADAEGVYTGFKENFVDKESCKGSTRKGIPGLASADPTTQARYPRVRELPAMTGGVPAGQRI